MKAAFGPSKTTAKFPQDVWWDVWWKDVWWNSAKKKFEQAGTLLSDLPFPADVWDADLWDEAVELLGRSARLMEELAELTGEAIARIAARGDWIDRIQKDTRALLNALVASEADA